MNSVNAVCSFVSYSNAGYSLGESCLVHRSDRCCLGSQRFFSCTGLWTILKHDGKRPCFLFRGYGILINLAFDARNSLIYRYTVYPYIYIYLWTYTILHHPWLIFRHARHAFQSSIAPIACPVEVVEAASSMCELRIFRFARCQKFWIRGCSELQRKISWNDLSISCNL